MKNSILMTLLRGSNVVSHRNIKTLASLLTAKSMFVPRSNDANQKEIESMSEFINRSSRLFVITGAGVSTESGIRDYRSEGVGLYATSTQRPIEFQDFLKYPLRRQRYWARNFAGWPLFSSFPPNITHEMLAYMEHYGNLHWLVTQNVDSLHKKAGSTKLTELHGSGARVGCLSCNFEICRHELQTILMKLNKNWNGGQLGVQGPDGDVIVDESSIEAFQMYNCPKCNGILKPKIVFFGDNVGKEIKDLCYHKLKESDALLAIGTSLEVYSSFRFIVAATDRNIPIAILNIGKTRGDKYATLKISAQAGDVLPRLRLKWSNDVFLST